MLDSKSEVEYNDRMNSLYQKSEEETKGGQQTELLSRSVAKTLSWRAIGTLDTIIICWVITGAWDFALAIGGIELVTKMILYFFHERAWGMVQWGTQ